MISLKRIKAILLQEIFITVRSYEVIFDIFVFPGMSIVVFGFLSLFIAGSSSSFLGHSLLMGMLLWQTIFIIQYSVSVGSLWNIWSHNLSNMFVTPISVAEYLISYMLSGLLKALLVFSISSVLIFYVFHFNILDLGLSNIILYLINLSIFSFAFGIMILALIFRFGTSIQAFAWGLLPVFQPLSAALYPVRVLPPFLQTFAYFLPPTYIFENAREVLAGREGDPKQIVIAFILNVIYFVLSLIFFHVLFKQAKEAGQFARNDG